MNVKDLIQQATNKFTESDTAKLDAQLLLADVLGKDRAWVMAWDDVDVSDADLRLFATMVARRVRGEPIAHILGFREFWGLTFECNSSTLIPRPETELLVEKALQLNLPRDARVLDLGTGTGAIALALASERPGWQIQAVDFSAEAIVLAARNRQNLGIKNVQLSQSDWFAGLTPGHRFDLIVANPPYVNPGNPYLNKGDVRFEPRSALVADNAGLADIEHIVASASHFLKPNQNCGQNNYSDPNFGWLIIEHGYEQAGPVGALFRKAGFSRIRYHNDLAGWPRITAGNLGSE
ncbi:MAG: peptide chain release factor N(5)-glutamine methyltransferase [Pseudohongiellaceae bacterium]